ncbi:methyltransferase type 11 [Sphingobium sp. Ant17]|nr:methyltransferase type 11 [Sphingobium sp. Ant17]
MHSAMSASTDAEKAATYWLYRATGVERFANMKNDPRTRANRIKTLLAELRDLQRGINTAHAALAIWDRFTTDEQIRHALGNMDTRKTWSNYDLYYKVDKGEITPADARQSCIEGATLAVNGPVRRRWIEHVLNRLAFERSMLGDVPHYDGELTPVIIQAFAREQGAEVPKCTVPHAGVFRLESPVLLPAHIAPEASLALSEDGWRDLMQASGYTVPARTARRVSAKPDAVPLINPSEEQAEQLQTIWNLHMVAACKGKHSAAKPNSIYSTTQTTYSANSKGDYAPFKTIEIAADGRRVRMEWQRQERVRSGEPVARIRISTIGAEFYKPDALLVITDKPSKPLPMDLDALEAAARQAAGEEEAAA